MRNNQSKSTHNNTLDLDRLEPADFYSEKRDSKVNRFSLIEEKLNQTKLNNLNNFDVNEEQSKRIFSDVARHEQAKKTQREFEDDSITDEILRVDLENDDTYVKDVFDEYDSSKIPTKTQQYKNEDSSDELVKDNNLFNDDELTTNHDLVTPTKTTLSAFVPTNPVGMNKTKEIKVADEIFEVPGEKKNKLHDVAAAIEDASNNQEEINKSIQIALDDVKKHEELDKEVESAILRNVSTVSLNDKTGGDFQEVNELEDNLKTDFEPSDEFNESTVEPTDFQTFSNFEEPDDEAEELSKGATKEFLETNDPTEDIKPIKKEYVFNFEDFKNTKTTTYTPELKTSIETPKPTNDDLKTNSNFALNDLMLEKIKEYADQEVQRQMEIERAKLELERLNLSSSIESELSKNRESQLAQLKIIDDAKKALEKERILFEEEKQAMADELMGVAKSERDVLNQERNEILSNAQKEKEALIAAAKKEINLERENLELEKQKLQASIAQSVNQTQKYFDQQRDILLNAVEKEKQRLLNQQAQKKAVGDKQTDLVLQEVQDLIKELRAMKGDNDQRYQELKDKLSEEARNSIKEAFSYAAKEKELIASEVEKFSEEQKKKFDELLSELNIVKQQAMIRSPSNIPTTVVSNKPSDISSELEAEMNPINEDRSYTEGPIDSIEIDDALEEESKNRKVYQLQTVDVDSNNEEEVTTKSLPTVQPITSELNNDVDLMRSALKQRDVDFDFEEQRQIYEKEKVKEEIKKELLEEMSKLTGASFPINKLSERSIEEDLEELDTSFQDDSLIDIGTKQFDDIAAHERRINPIGNHNQDDLHEIGSIRLKSKETVPELINNKKAVIKGEYENQTNLYDLDLFDELGIDTYLDNDNMAVEAITNELDQTSYNNPVPIHQPENNFAKNNFKPNSKRPPFFGSKSKPKVKFVIEPPTTTSKTNFYQKPAPSIVQPAKQKLRGAKMINENKFDNLSSKDLIKAYAQEILNKNKKTKKQK